MITSNFVHRVYRIRCGSSIGTAFAIDVGGRQYLVTAKHVVEAFSPEAPLQVGSAEDWLPREATLVGHAQDADVSVLALSAPITPPNLPVIASSAGLAYGQDVYFLGFPYGVLSRVMFEPHGHPLALVKRATMSAFAGKIYLLDGHNNPGFSGGPVIFAPGGGTPTHIAAVISGYRFANEPVLAGDQETLLSNRQNTGIIITYKIEVALELIERNPIGPTVQ